MGSSAYLLGCVSVDNMVDERVVGGYIAPGLVVWQRHGHAYGVNEVGVNVKC